MMQTITQNFKEDDKNTIESLLMSLELDYKTEVIVDILYFIGNMLSESIAYNQKRIADLFCRTISKIKKTEISKDLENHIIEAFENINRIFINRISIDNIERGNICILTLLSVLFNNREIQDSEQIKELIDSGFIDLIDDLENISILFIIRDEQQIKYFPIEIFLCRVLDVNNFIRALNKTSTIQALMFALQGFFKFIEYDKFYIFALSILMFTVVEFIFKILFIKFFLKIILTTFGLFFVVLQILYIELMYYFLPGYGFENQINLVVFVFLFALCRYVLTRVSHRYFARFKKEGK